MKVKYLIIGSGIGGLAAAAALKFNGENDFVVVDRAASLPLNLANGVHYLHSDHLGLPFDFPLKRIPSTEEIWHPRTDTFKKTSCVPEMIDYSMKVMGTRHPSSIMDPGNRSWETFLPESNNMNDLLQAYYDYIGAGKFMWNMMLSNVNLDGKVCSFIGNESMEYDYVINTSPLNTFMDSCGIMDIPVLKNQPIFINNYTTENIVANWLISLYISDDQFPPYRITIMNNIISMESVREMTSTDEHVVKYHLGRYFYYNLWSGTKFKWDTGRIFGLDKQKREEIIAMFEKYSIHLVGRFARWDGKMIMDTTAIQAKNIVSQLLKEDMYKPGKIMQTV